MIDVIHVNKYYGDHHVLKDISVHFERGKTNLVIGRSGSGKTVLLKSIVGLEKIDEGEVLYEGRDLIKMTQKQVKEIRKELGMLFQGGALFDSATIEENVIFPLDMFSNMTFEEKRERANTCLKRVNLVNVNSMYPAELSGGMKKRAAIARALSINPQYLFCDEPNSGLDPKTAILIDNLIKEITEEYNITTIVNTHDMNSVMEIGDKVVFIYKGEKCWEGSNEDILESDNKTLNDFIFASNLTKLIKKVPGAMKT